MPTKTSLKFEGCIYMTEATNSAENTYYAKKVGATFSERYAKYSL